MVRDADLDYLAGLPADQQATLERVNAPGFTSLHGYLKSGDALVFLGAGASAPLYPLWAGLIGELVDAAAGRLSQAETDTCRSLAGSAPEEVVEIVRRKLGGPSYHAVLREVLQVRTDPATGRSWTGLQELVCRCAFRAVVTTNYDPGIVDARMRVRPCASATGFMTWQDELGLDEWRTGRVFRGDDLPVLYAHGVHSQPESVVLAASDYRRAYSGKLPQVLERLADGGHLCWIGFSFADQRLAAILREVPLLSGTRHDPGAASTHVAIMAWDPVAEANDPRILAQRAEIAYGAQVILYPAPGGDHSALAALLAMLADAKFPAAEDAPARSAPAAAGLRPGSSAAASGVNVAMRWVPPSDPVAYFTGRAEELVRLDRWAADPDVRLVGVSAWGGAGKTALVTHWVSADGGANRPGLRGVFGWSFYTDPSAEHWVAGLLAWAQRDLGVPVPETGRAAGRVLAVLATVPVLLVLDGLEVVQEGPAEEGFGRLLDGPLREVLTGACQMRHAGLVLLTSRFPFADLETFDGGAARMLELPPFSRGDGAALVAAAGGGWLPERERRELVTAVDGHALAVTVLAGLLAAQPPADLTALRQDLATATRTNTRVSKVLSFYAARLAEADRYLLAAVSLFTRPVSVGAVLTVAADEAFGGHLAGWTRSMVQAAVRDRLAGLATWHPDATISAHPLVRDTFRPLALEAATTAASTSLTGLPEGRVTSRADALRVTEAIKLLLEADQWQAADDLYQARCGSAPSVWQALPAARLGQLTATAFVGTPARQGACATHLSSSRRSFYLNAAGMFAMSAGDLAMAHQYLTLATRHGRDAGDKSNLAASLRNLAQCMGRLGQVGPARDVAAEALTSSETVGHRDGVRRSHAFMGWLAGLAGDIAAAEQHFTAADQIHLVDHNEHLPSFIGVLWAQWLIRTGRVGPAGDLMRRNADISREHGWNFNLARCNQILGDLALSAGNVATAETYLNAAVIAFRDGDLLTDLAEALPSLASCAQATGDLDTAARRLADAFTVAAPRRLIPAHATALADRARLRAVEATATGNTYILQQGRDDADAARRMAVRHQLPWHELNALRAHASLDEAEGTSHDWAIQAEQLQAQLMPPGLDPDPLATVERLTRT